MGTRALTAIVAGLVVAVTAGVGVPATSWRAAAAEPPLFAAMSALSVTPPVAVPEVRFEELDGRPATLKAFRGRPVLLTFFTTW